MSINSRLEVLVFISIILDSVNLCRFNLQNDHNIRIVAIPARKSSRLEVSKASIDFNGEYQCIVSNVAGSVMRSFMVELMQG